jgi:hypothetical protein
MTCSPGTLAARLLYFKNKMLDDGLYQLEWLIQEHGSLQTVVVERGDDSGRFVTEKIITPVNNPLYSHTVTVAGSGAKFRLKLVQKDGAIVYSQVLSIAGGVARTAVKVGPVPATNKLDLQLNSPDTRKADYSIFSTSGIAVASGNLRLQQGENRVSISLDHLKPGSYLLQLGGLAGEGQPISLRFVKQ